MFTSLESPVTFSESFPLRSSHNSSSGKPHPMFDLSQELITINPLMSDSDQVCLYESNPNNVSFSEDHYDTLPQYPYTFNTNIYKAGTFLIPRNIFQTIPTSKKKQPNRSVYNSVSYHMPHWNYLDFTLTQQQDFIAKYFPERLTLYKKYKYDEERTNLFIYLWLYMNGGIYISPDYELIKTLEPILDSANTVDLYFMFDEERYISPKILASQPFCGFWIEVVDLMEKRKNHKYQQAREEIDRNTGRGILTDVVEETQYKYEIISRLLLDPYNSCDTKYDKDSCLRPLTNMRTFMTYMKCQTGSSDELIYITGAIIFIIGIMIFIALITR